MLSPKFTIFGGVAMSVMSQLSHKKLGSKNVLGSITRTNSRIKQSLAEHTSGKKFEKHQTNRRLTYALKDTAGRLLPSERVASCLCCRIDAERGVDVRLNKASGKANYGNLLRCDSIWNCPSCHQRIMAKRGAEVEQGVKTWTEAGGSVFMLTLTHSHQRIDNLMEKMDRLRAAVGELFSHRTMRNIWDQAGKVGQIRALEITQSDANGWHPHHHYLIFSNKSPKNFMGDAVSVTREKDGSLKYLTPFAENQILKKAEKKAQKELKKEQKIFAELIDLVENEEVFVGRDYVDKQEFLANAPTKRGAVDNIETVNIEMFIKHFWKKICTDVGLGAPSLEHGAVIEDASKVKTYLTKFKTSQELTNSQAKRAKGASRNQWEILADAMAGDAHAGKLFQTYAAAFKNERTVFWSKNLKKMLLIGEVDDSEIEELEGTSDDEIINVIELAVDDWGCIRRKKLQSELLEVVENDFKNGTDNLSIFIYTIKKLLEIERAEWARQKAERLANLCPPQWFVDVHNAA